MTVAATSVANLLSPFKDKELSSLWTKAASADRVYERVRSAVLTKERELPSDLGLKLQLGDCTVGNDGLLRYGGRLWIPGAPVLGKEDWDNLSQEEKNLDILRTRII